MYFDDEKDYIGNTDNQADTISWDTILDTDEDGIVSIKEDKTSTQDGSADYSATNDIPDINSIDLGDDLAIVDDDDDVNDEDELKRILSSDDSETSSYDFENTDEYDSGALQQEYNAMQDNSEDITPRREETKNKAGVSPVLILLLLILVIAGISYFVFTFLSNRDEDDDVSQLNTEAQAQTEQNNQMANNENIPVVNEEEVDSLKADEEKKDEEKKEIINVIPTGRTDPFLPLKRYTTKPVSTETKIINSIDYDSIKLPFAAPKDESISKNIDKLMSIAVSGIMYDSQKPSAIITYNDNDYFVLKGDKLDDFTVVAIGPNYVKISYGKNIYTAKVGEKFVINDFYGNSPIRNGSRQYYSSEEEYNTINGIKPEEYTSGRDIKIFSK